MLENSSHESVPSGGCSFCGNFFYNEPPPDDIMFIPAPPLYPGIHQSFSELVNSIKRQTIDQCNYCNSFQEGAEQSSINNSNYQSNGGLISSLLIIITVSALIILYLLSMKRSKIVASITRAKLFGSSSQVNTNNRPDKNATLNRSIANNAGHLTDPCYIQTNQDKNLTSPIISDHVPHKKTAIPSNCWAQPGSIIGRTIRRIPNEYEVPSSRTNSTGTSSAVYADMNNDGHRFFSPYNMHTYAEVREVLDPNEHFHNGSNSSAIMSESNYDNAVYPQGACLLSNGGVVTTVPKGSVQMSDFNSIRPMQTMNYHTSGQQIYEQPPQRAQVIITSNNQGVNPTLISYKERSMHNVI